MQDQQRASTDKFDITSPTFSKSVTFCFNFDQDHPLQLISWEEGTGFTVNPLAEKFFESLKNDKLGVIAIVGKNRTGKSSLLNRVILNRNSGFNVGHTINPCTKGIWIWPHIIQIQDKKGENEKVKVIVMDTEGTGATDQRDNYDTQVFMLAMMLSSYFIYNSVGAIDEKAIQNLSLIVNLSKHLQKTNEKEFEDLVESFPSFLWVLRDFALKLVDARGNPITSKEYLENALKPQKGVSESTESKNRIRRFLTNFFKDRDCFMMIRPTESEKDMQNLQNLEEEKLRPEFSEQVNALRRKICSKVKPKMFKGKPVNGPAFIVLCKLLCHTINCGEVLSIENSWNSICKIECEKILRELIDKYEEEIQTNIKNISSETQIRDLHKEPKQQKLPGKIKKKNEILDTFKKRAMGDNVKDYEEKLNQAIKQKYEFFKKMQTNDMRDKLKAELDMKFEGFETKLRDKEFKSFIEVVTELKTHKIELEKEYTDNSSREVLFDYLFHKGLYFVEAFVDDMMTSLHQNEAINRAKMENLEARIGTVREEFEAKGIEYMETIRSLEGERSKLKIELISMEEKIEKMEQEKEKLKQQADAKVENLVKDFQAREGDLMEKVKGLQLKVDELEKEKQEIYADNDKKFAIQSQQLEFSTKQVNNLTQSLADLKKELMEEKELHTSSVNALDELKRSMNISMIKANRQILATEIEGISEDNEEVEEPSSTKMSGKRKRLVARDLNGEREANSANERRNFNADDENQELRRRVDILTGRMESNVEEFLNQKNALERMVREAESHYHEMHLQSEAAILALNKKIGTYETTNQALIDINKKIAASLERADIRALKFEKRVERLKKFEKLLKYCENVSCRFCKQTISKDSFKEHLSSCLQDHNRSFQIDSSHENSELHMSFENTSVPSPMVKNQVKYAKNEIQPKMGRGGQKISNRYLKDWSEKQDADEEYEKTSFNTKHQKGDSTERGIATDTLGQDLDQLEQVEQNESVVHG